MMTRPPLFRKEGTPMTKNTGSGKRKSSRYATTKNTHRLCRRCQLVQTGHTDGICDECRAIEREVDAALAGPSPFSEYVTAHADDTRLDDALQFADTLLDRMVPRHLRACSVFGCVDQQVAVLEHADDRQSRRLCQKHLHAALNGIRQAAREERQARRREAVARAFDALSPIEQYQRESR
jgi:hypothetical protein